MSDQYGVRDAVRPISTRGGGGGGHLLHGRLEQPLDPRLLPQPRARRGLAVRPALAHELAHRAERHPRGGPVRPGRGRAPGEPHVRQRNDHGAAHLQEGRGVSDQYGVRDAACPISTG